MTDVVSPDTHCERCNSRSVHVEWDDVDRKYTRRCLSCGRIQGAAIAQANKPKEKASTEEAKVTDNGAITEAKPYKSWAPKADRSASGAAKVVPDRSTAPSNGSAAIATKADSAAAKALHTYDVATRHYLDERELLTEDEARLISAQEGVERRRATMATALSQMAEARAALDHELSLLTPSGESKPFHERVKVRAAPTGNLPERACPTCGKAFKPLRESHRYCSFDCRMVGTGKHKVSETAAEPVEALA